MISLLATLGACASESTPPTTGSAVPWSTAGAAATSGPTSIAATSAPADEPLVLRGEGSLDVDYPAGVDRVVVHATHSGDHAFSVAVVDQSGEPVEVVAFALPGHPYDGTQLITTPLDEVGMLRVQADGQWTIELLGDLDVPSAGDDFSGSGNAVVRYEGTSGTATITSDATGVFQVRAEDGRSVVPELNGPYSGVEQMPAGPVLVEIRSFGSWSVSIDPSGQPADPTESAGTTITAANAAQVDECFRVWVDAQGLAAEEEITEDHWRTTLRTVSTGCDDALSAVEPLALRSPRAAPLRVLADVLYGIVLLASDAAMYPCNQGMCHLSASMRATLLQFTPDHDDVPDALYGFLGDRPTVTTTVIPGLQTPG